jgi:hypothetical protein
MPWMRVAIGVGGSVTLAGAAGMVAWIDNGSHYFELAAALASAGFLTLVACFLTSVFGSSHGSQDDAFRRGRSMGYDAGFLEGHRTARPVVVPLHAVEPDVHHDLEVASSEIDHDDKRESPPTAMPMWRGDAMPLLRRGARERTFDWLVASRTVLVAGALCLALIGVLVANASVPATVSAGALPLTPGTRVYPADPSHAAPALVSKTRRSGWSVSVGTGGTLLVPGVAGAPPVSPDLLGISPLVPNLGAAVVQSAAALSSSPGTGAVAAGPAYQLVTSPIAAPAVVPVVPAPVVPLTAAQQTAANAAAAADLTAANAKAAADLTAANAAAAAAETARVAAAAAETTRLQALADAYAVAHPGA